MAITSIYNQPISASSIDVVQVSGSVLGTIDGDTISSLTVTSSYALQALSASYALSASVEIIKEVSSSHADSADFATSATSASYALTSTSAGSANTALAADSASYVALAVKTGSVAGNTLTFQKFDGTSFNLVVAQTGSVESASFAETARSASHALQANNANLASTASYILGSNVDGVVASATSASHAIQADSALAANTATSASHAVQADSALTATSATTATTATQANQAYVQVSAANVDYHVTFNTINAGYKELLQETQAAQFTYNPSNNKLTVENISATTLSGSLFGNATTATSASHALVSDTTLGGYADNTIVYGKNLEATTLLKGTPVYFTGSGTSGNIVGLLRADAGNPARMPAGGVVGENILTTAEGVVLLDGFINGVNTSAFASGDEVYVAVGGGYTNVAPTGSSNLVQKLGNVEKVDTLNGSGVINGPGASRSVPNIAQNNVWVGNVDGVAVPTNVNTLSVATASLALDIDPAADITVNTITASNASFLSASIGYLTSITGSAKIIGDAFIILNNDTPTERYAGIKVIDSGSVPSTTASIQFDGLGNDWFYEYAKAGDPDDYAVFLAGPEYNTKGSPVYPTANQIQKGTGGHHLTGSNISDDGTNVIISSNSQITGSLGVTGGITGTLNGNATTATSASHALQADSALAANTATSASHAIFADTAGSAGSATTAVSASHAVFADSAASAATATSASHAVFADSAGSAGSATTAVSASHALFADAAGSATTATTAATASYVAGANVDGTVASATSASYAPLDTSLNNSWTGNQLFSGSVRGEINALSIASNTASLDLSNGNFYTLTLVSGSNTHINPSNIAPGQTVNLRITQANPGDGTVSFPSSVKQVSGSAYVPTAGSGPIDIVTLISFDGSSLYLSNVQNLI